MPIGRVDRKMGAQRPDQEPPRRPARLFTASRAAASLALHRAVARKPSFARFEALLKDALPVQAFAVGREVVDEDRGGFLLVPPSIDTASNMALNKDRKKRPNDA